MDSTKNTKDIIDDLEEDHRLIEQLSGSMLFVCQNIQGEEKWQALRQFLDLSKRFDREIHHTKEEEILFPAFAEIGIDLYSKPLDFLREEHQETEQFLEKAQKLIEKKEDDAMLALVNSFCHLTWKHIDKEDSVILREGRQRLHGKILFETNAKLNKFYVQHEQEIDRLLAQAKPLIEKYPPIDDLPDLVRSDGCLVCDHYGVGCDGIEHEWWSELEWEDFKARNQGD